MCQLQAIKKYISAVDGTDHVQAVQFCCMKRLHPPERLAVVRATCDVVLCVFIINLSAM